MLHGNKEQIHFPYQFHSDESHLEVLTSHEGLPIKNTINVPEQTLNIIILTEILLRFFLNCI